MECRACSESLTAYMDGELPGVDRESVMSHLGGCPDCRTRYESLRFSYEVVSRLPRVSYPAELWSNIESVIVRTPPPRIPWFGELRFLVGARWVPTGAVLLLAIMAGSFLMLLRSSRSPQLERVLQSYIQERQREFSRTDITVRQAGVGFTHIHGNPFADLNRKAKGNPFKRE